MQKMIIRITAGLTEGATGIIPDSSILTPAKYNERSPGIANAFDVKTTNGSRDTDNTTGIESIANTRSDHSAILPTI
jgi:hypothetical protein